MSAASVAAQLADYFENTVVGKITEPRVAVFWAAAQSVYGQIQLKIHPFTNVYYTWNVYLAT